MYDEAEAKVAYLGKLQRLAAHQDLAEDLRPQVRIVTIVFTAIGVFFVYLRFMARWKKRAQIWVDEWTILLSVVLLIANGVYNLIMVGQGLGLHSGALGAEQLQTLNHTLIGAEILYLVTVTSYKISVLFLYYRIFPVRSLRIGAYICGGVSAGWTAICVIAVCFQCIPLSKTWHPWLEGTCLNVFVTQLCVAVPNILCDVAILALPIPQVWRLRINLTQKIFVVGVFLLGSYVVFTSIYRFRVFLLYSPDDVSYTLAYPCAWNIVEMSSGIVSACLPTLAPLVRMVIRSVQPSTPRSGTNEQGSSSGARWSHVLKVAGGNASKGPSRKGLSTSGPESGCSAPGTTPFVSSTTTKVSHSHGASDMSPKPDGTPPTAIRQERHIEWSEERIDPPDGTEAEKRDTV